jgi:hypothetical protein
MLQSLALAVVTGPAGLFTPRIVTKLSSVDERMGGALRAGPRAATALKPGGMSRTILSRFTIRLRPASGGKFSAPPGRKNPL